MRLQLPHASSKTRRMKSREGALPARKWARRRRGNVAHLLLATAVATGLLVTTATSERVDPSGGTAATVFPIRKAVPQRACRSNDRPETGLQGRVPPTDVLSGRALRGYSCNMRLVGHFPTTTWASFDVYRNCAYLPRGPGAGGVLVLDISDPANPRPTDVLATPAMLDPWESLRVNAKRGLLVAAGDPKPFIDVYDVRQDCRHPRLLSSKAILPAKGHEGWFDPDGLTYYVSTTRSTEGVVTLPTLFPIDLINPRQPKLRTSWNFDGQTHGGMTTEDGKRSYVCQQEAPPDDALMVLDTSRLKPGESSPQPRVLAEARLGDNQWCQGAYRVTYDGRPYLIQYGERSGAPDCSRVADNWATFGYPRFIDLAHEKRPKVVSSALLEVQLPQHCSKVEGEGAVNGFGYSVHHCAPDRLYDPTILACSYFHGGLRVLDIRNPRRPVELGYFNPGVNGALGTAARPVILAERGEIWFTNDVGGVYAVRFRNGIWPFARSARCPAYSDHYYAHYNPSSGCRKATFAGIDKPAPAAPQYRYQ